MDCVYMVLIRKAGQQLIGSVSRTFVTPAPHRSSRQDAGEYAGPSGRSGERQVPALFYDSGDFSEEGNIISDVLDHVERRDS
jgi:hypothetical protein